MNVRGASTRDRGRGESLSRASASDLPAADDDEEREPREDPDGSRAAEKGPGARL
jgi:hypothetical protein